MNKRPEHPSKKDRDAIIAAAIALPAGADRLFLKADDLTFGDANEVYFARGRCPNGTPFTVAIPFCLFLLEEAQRGQKGG